MTGRPAASHAAFSGLAPARPKGHLATNIVHFVRVLRAAGIPAGPERTIAALEDRLFKTDLRMADLIERNLAAIPAHQ